MKQQIENDFFREYAATSTHFGGGSITYDKQSYFLYKRLLDILFSLIGIFISLPIILTFIIIIRLETPGSAFFLQERVGLNGRYFKVIKLRSMGIDAEVNGAQWAEKNDPRVTKVGTFIRKTRIDELPQLINVLLGDMTLVGPRPERAMFTAKFNDEIPGFVTRLSVKPGLTGWAQVNGGYDLTPEEKFNYDRYYMDNQSVLFDIKIILKTVKICFTGEGSR